MTCPHSWYHDSATVVYKVAVTDGKVYHGEGSNEEPDDLTSLQNTHRLLWLPDRT